MKKTKKNYREPAYRFSIQIRDRNHLATIIAILNRDCGGSGMQNWTMTKKVIKYLRRKPVTPVKTDVLIFRDDIDTKELETLIKLL